MKRTPLFIAIFFGVAPISILAIMAFLFLIVNSNKGCVSDVGYIGEQKKEIAGCVEK